ncbi:MAG: Gfo/Idh/MocA family protein [Blautia massiliensis (ex Durand et al. 2017)]
MYILIILNQKKRCSYEKIKAGVIGGGNIAEFHLNDMVKNENIIPYALCDVNQESLDKTGDRYNIPKENRYTDYKELLARSDIDMVSICTPNVTHFSIAMDTVKSGKAYVLEKPVAMTLAEAKRALSGNKKHRSYKRRRFFLPLSPGGSESQRNYFFRRSWQNPSCLRTVY